MTSNAPAACCFRGFKHEGIASGENKKIGSVDTYFAYPKDDKKKGDKAILLLTDAFGIRSNSQFLADDFASKGYLTIIPDILNNDSVTQDALKAGMNIYDWIAKHGPETVDPVIEASIKYLREEEGIKKIGAVGYCFGGKYVARFLKDDKVNVGYMAHPSFVTDEELSSVTGPLSIAAAETDTVFTTELRHKSEEIMQKTGQLYQINLFGGVEHGFAVRADLSVPQNKFAKEQAFLQAVTWFNYCL